MKASIEWLSEYSNINVEPKQLGDILTMTGSKVEAIEQKGNDIKNVVVGKILEIERHPDADKLVVTKVNVGDEIVQIVTGADNIKVNDIVPIAKDGSELPGGVKIKKGQLRGVDSCGMMCSVGELGLKLEDYPGQIDHGIMILPKSYEEYLQLALEYNFPVYLETLLYEFKTLEGSIAQPIINTYIEFMKDEDVQKN